MAPTSIFRQFSAVGELRPDSNCLAVSRNDNLLVVERESHGPQDYGYEIAYSKHSSRPARLDKDAQDIAAQASAAWEAAVCWGDE